MEEVFDKLGLNKGNGLYLMKEGVWKTEVVLPSRIRRLIELRLKPDAFFCFDNKPLILFFKDPTNKAELHKAIWNFNECPVAIIIENDAIEIFNGFKYAKALGSLEVLESIENLNNFSYFQLVTGKTWEVYQQELNFKNRVDYKLLENIKTARKLLVESGGLDYKIANAILGKSIFVRYLIDRKVALNFEGQSKLWTNNEFCHLCANPERLRAFFSYLENKDTGFNGDLFPIEESEFGKIDATHLEVIRNLLSGVQLEKRQPSLFDLYDFSVIPIEFISNVYEMFIGQENQRTTGSYYTPLFLVDYILNETVQKRLNEIPDGAFRRDLSISEIVDNSPHLTICKVLDPACGSGIFLVETLRKIIEKYIKDTGIDNSSGEFKEIIKGIAKANLFGIDKDESAIQVAIFSVYLTLLDYLEPPAIENFKFPYLLNSNFFQADFFDVEHEYNVKLKEKGFDFILGNPPWMRGKGEKVKPLYVKYIEKRKKVENGHPEIGIGNREIAQAFVLRSSDFSIRKTKCGLIVTSKVLYNIQSAAFRQYFLHRYFIDRVFEMAPVRREVFDRTDGGAIAPACILFFHFANGEDTANNIIEHISLKPSGLFSLFKILILTRSDVKKVQQNKLLESDWLWKLLVYGNYLDYNFIKRIKDKFKKVSDLVYDTNEFVVKQGLKRVDGAQKIDVSILRGWNFVDTSHGHKNLQQYFVTAESEKWNLPFVGHVNRNEKNEIITDIFTPPALLVKDGLSTNFTIVSAILKKKAVFTDNITSIKPLTDSASSTLDNIMIVLNSSLGAYWGLQTASFVGIKQERSHDIEKFSMPFVYVENSSNFSNTISSLKEKMYSINFKRELIEDFSKIIQRYLKKVDNLIYDRIAVNDCEKALIDYALNISIPLISGKYIDKDRFLIADITLNNYASLYLDRFKNKFLSAGKQFVIDIWHTPQIIGMLFRLVDISEEREEIKWTNKAVANEPDVAMIRFIASVSSKKITERLFVQKDVRGFEHDYFYIFKPNEKRLWHKAIGYLDVEDFADAILKAGRDQADV